MRFSSKEYSEIFNQAAKKLSERTGITNFSPSSKAGSLLTSFIQEEKNKVNSINSILDSFKLSSATDGDLDQIGEFIGVTRLLSTRAFTKANDQNIEFFVNSGTFGDINNGTTFTIPANTLIYLDDKDSFSGLKTEYRLISPVTCLSTANSAYGSVEAIEPGIKYNVASFALNKHSFTSYSQANLNTLKVRNNYSIVNGRNTESNSNYRNRISKAFTAFATSNETSLRLAAGVFPGVKEVKFIRNYNGIGSSALIVDVYEGSISNTLLTSIQDRVNLFASSGEVINVYAPKYIEFEIELTIKTSIDFSINDKVNSINTINNIIKNYVASLAIGRPLDLTILYAAIIQTNSKIVQIGKISNQNVADRLTIYYSDASGNTSNKTLVQDLLTVGVDQKVILAEVATPITINFEKA